MKRTTFIGILVVVVFCIAIQANAITLGIDPAGQNVGIGSSFNVNLTISGLEDFNAPSLGTFDVDIAFDSSILALNNVDFGDPVLGDQLDLFGFGNLQFVTTGMGTVNLFELSFDTPDDLNLLQAGSFVLSTLTFNALAGGASTLEICVNALGDADGNPLGATIVNGTVNVASATVPEPSTMLLFGSSLLGLGLTEIRRRFRK